MWRVKNKEPVVQEEVQEVDLDEDLESETEMLKQKIKELEQRKEQKKVPEIKPKQKEQDTGLNKQEVIDAIQGNLARASSLIELLRR